VTQIVSQKLLNTDLLLIQCGRERAVPCRQTSSRSFCLTTSQRKAELQAANQLGAASERRALHVKSDSEYVVKGIRQRRFAWSTTGFHKVSNADLWKEVHALLTAREHCFRITKVKGHATLRDVRSGRVKPEDKQGNDAADRLATAATAQSAPSETLVQLHRARSEVAADVQTMMVNILTLRSNSTPQTNCAQDVISIRSSCSTSSSSSSNSASLAAAAVSRRSSSVSSGSCGTEPKVAAGRRRSEACSSSRLALFTGVNHPT
jgi:ribonuclease HI